MQIATIERKVWVASEKMTPWASEINDARPVQCTSPCSTAQKGYGKNFLEFRPSERAARGGPNMSSFPVDLVAVPSIGLPQGDRWLSLPIARRFLCRGATKHANERCIRSPPPPLEMGICT